MYFANSRVHTGAIGACRCSDNWNLDQLITDEQIFQNSSSDSAYGVKS